MTRPEVSVVIPTRNRLPLLAQTLHTVLAQRDVDLDVIVVDEASTDETPTWLADHPDPRVRTIRHDTPKGLSNARNAGIAAATGHWLGFTDDDDLWLPDKLTRQLDGARRDGADWVCGGEIVFTDEPRLLHVTLPPDDLIDVLPTRNAVPGGGSNVIIARDAIEAVKGFDPAVNIVADWDLWLRLLPSGSPAIVQRPVMAYRIHGSNMSKNVDELFAGVDEIERRYEQLLGGRSVDREAIFGWSWISALRTGDRRTAFELAKRARQAAHPGANRRMLRSLVPLPLRDPIADRRDASGLLDRLRPRRVVPWPPGIESWLRQTLAVTP